MLRKELFEGRWPGVLERLACWPTAPHLADESGADVIKPWYHPREVGLQQGGHAIAEPGAILDPAASGRHEIGERSGLRVIWPPGLESVPLVDERFKQIICSPRIILGSAGRECFTVLGPRGRVKRGEDPKGVLQERIDEGAASLLPTDGNRPSAKAEAPHGGPGSKLFRGVLEETGLFRASGAVNQTDSRLGL